MTIPENNFPLCVLSHFRFMGNKNDSYSQVMIQAGKEVHYIFCIFCIKITSWLVGKNNGRFINQCPGNGNPLLLSTGQLTWMMMLPAGKSDHTQVFPSLILHFPGGNATHV